MNSKNKLITALALISALVAFSASPAFAATGAKKTSDSARILKVAVVGAQAIKDGNFTKFCQMLTPKGRSSWASFGGPGSGGTCRKGSGTVLTTGQFESPWATNLLAYFNGGKATVTFGKFTYIGSGHDAKIQFNLPVKGNPWKQTWGFRALRGKAACYTAKGRCWRISLVASEPIPVV